MRITGEVRYSGQGGSPPMLGAIDHCVMYFEAIDLGSLAFDKGLAWHVYHTDMLGSSHVPTTSSAAVSASC